MAIYHSRVARGSSSHALHPAPADRRYIGKFYWSAYWCSWSKVIDITAKGWWVVHTVDLNGQLVADEHGNRTHCTAMEACHFADAPFPVMSRYAADAIVRR